MSERKDSKNRILNSGEYQSANGRYMYRYADTNGKSRYVYSWTLTQSDRPPKGKKVTKCLRELEREIAKDLHDGIDSYNAKSITLNTSFDDYMSQRYDLKESSKGLYIYMYNKYVRDSFGNRNLQSIKYSDVKKFYVHLINNVGLDPSSVDIINHILHPIFKIAVRDNIIRVNPADNVLSEIKKSNNWARQHRHALTKTEEKNFLNYIKNSKIYCHWYSLFIFLLGTGCRIGETISLTWNDCDFENDLIYINRSLSYKIDSSGEVRYMLSTPKTESGKRVIPMLDEVKNVLQDEYIRQSQNGFSKFTIDDVSGFVFINKNNRVYTGGCVNQAIRHICYRYNLAETENAKKENREPELIRPFTAHNLRHTFCTRLCQSETNLKIIQDIMGHKNIQTTMDIYNEVTAEDKKDSFKRLKGKVLIM